MTGDSRQHDADAATLAGRVHAAEGRICLAVTGAGTRAVAWLFGEPGASRTFLDVQVPYSSASLDEYTGRKAKQHVSAEAAMAMAEAALKRAASLAEAEGLPGGTPLSGVGCTAAIATDRVRRGEDRCHVAIATSLGLRRTYSLVMRKGERDRAGEELVCSQLVMNAVAEAKGVAERLHIELLPGEGVVVTGDTGEGTGE